MFQSKIEKSLLCISLSVILAVVFSLVFFCRAQQTELVTRQIDVDAIGNLSYEESYEAFLNQFSDYETDVKDDKCVFAGTINLNTANYGIDFLSSEVKNFVLKYSTIYDIENNIFEVITYNYADGVLIEQSTEYAKPYYEENKDDLFLKLENGSVISVKDTLGWNKEDCLALTLFSCGLFVALLFTVAVVPVVQNPSFYAPVGETISNAFTNIGNFFRRLFSKPVATTTVDKYLTLSASDEAKAKQPPRDIRIYQIAYCTKDSTLQASKVKLKWIEALAVLNAFRPLNKILSNATGALVNVSNVDVGKLDPQVNTDIKSIPQSAFVGIYTQNRIDAARLANAVGPYLYDSGKNFGKLKIETHNTKIGSKYYYHFHDVNHEIHIWYGSPI